MKLPPYLEKHGNGYRVTVPIPKHLQPITGTIRLRQSLGTDSFKEAMRLMGPVVHEFLTMRKEAQEAFDRGEIGPPGKKGRLIPRSVREAQEIGLHYREAMEAARDDDQVADVHYAMDAEVERIEDELTRSRRMNPRTVDPDVIVDAFLGVARGGEISIEVALERCLEERSDLLERTKTNYKRSVGYFLRHCEERGVRPTMEAIDRKEAGEFVRLAKTYGDGAGRSAIAVSNKTVNTHLSALQSLWKWAIRRGYATTNIWTEQSLPKERRTRHDRQRPFTDEEIGRLIQGEPPRASLRPIMLIAALSGARLDAVVSLRVKGVQDGVFRFKPQKKEPDWRTVPIHSALVTMVAELAKGADGLGKSPEQDLFTLPDGSPEYPVLTRGVERSSPASKAFTRYRRKVGVAEESPDRRRSLVDFHSFRRWFITKAHQAGQPPYIIESVVGHKNSGMSLGTYSQGPSLDQLKACVEAVKLPVDAVNLPE